MNAENVAQNTLKEVLPQLKDIVAKLESADIAVDTLNAPVSGNHNIKEKGKAKSTLTPVSKSNTVSNPPVASNKAISAPKASGKRAASKSSRKAK